VTDLSGILLAVDCDGTLLRNDQTISRRNLDAIDAFRSLGGGFTLATGRSIPTGEQYLIQTKADLPVVLCNGGMVYDPLQKRPLWEAFLPDEVKPRLYEVAAQFGQEVGIEVLGETKLFAANYNDVVDEHLNGTYPIPHERRELDQILDVPWYKVVFAARPGKKQELMDYLAAHPIPGARLVSSGLAYYELLPAYANKGAALEKACAFSGYSMAHTVAMGDFPNDVEMVRMAGFGVCVKNAVDELKNCAQLIAPSNEEDAVAWVIEYIIAHGQELFRR
jgi:Cof subfamily protein (haloacid dehalogenase superfamily)